MDLRQLIVENPKNRVVIQNFGLEHEKVVPLNHIQNNDLTDAAGEFLKEYSQGLPDETKYLIGNLGILVNPTNGEIFGIQFGWHDIAFRCNLIVHNFNTKDLEELRVFRNLDGIILDKRNLAENWVLAIHFTGSVEEELKLAYDFSVSATPR